jgi:hypothetical protein
VEQRPIVVGEQELKARRRNQHHSVCLQPRRCAFQEGSLVGHVLDDVTQETKIELPVCQLAKVVRVAEISGRPRLALLFGQLRIEAPEVCAPDRLGDELAGESVSTSDVENGARANGLELQYLFERERTGGFPGVPNGRIARTLPKIHSRRYHECLWLDKRGTWRSNETAHGVWLA